MTNQNGGLHKDVSAIFGGSTSTGSSGVLLEEQPQSQPLTPPAKPEIESKMLPASLNNIKSSVSLLDRAMIWVEQQKATGDIRQVVMVALIPILFCILTYFLWGSIFPPKPATNNQPSSTAKATVSPASPASSSQPAGKYMQAALYPENLRDPMAVASASASKANSALQTGGLSIKGILFNATNPEKSSAIIDNKVLKVGGKIADIEVTEITRDYVEFKNKDKVWREAVRQ